MRATRFIRLAFAGALALTATTASAAPRRTYNAGRFALSIDGEAAGYVMGPDAGPKNLVRKHISNIKHEEITVEVGMGMSRPMFAWIQGTLDGKRPSRTLTVARDAEASREFFGAHIAEVKLPTLDASSKDPARVSIKLDPERSKFAKTPPALARRTGPRAARAKLWRASNFRMEIDGLPDARVSKIDAFTIKQAVIKDEVGQSSPRAAGKVEVPNITFYVSTSTAEAIQGWDPAQKRALTIALTDNAGKPWAKLRIGGATLKSIRPAGRRFRVTLKPKSIRLTR